MKRAMFSVLAVLFLVIITLICIGRAYAGGVTDTNNGNKGDIFISTGENHGANSVGEWTSPKEWVEDYKDILKGDKGDKGDPGLNGKDGYTPIKGKDYFDGVNGKDGLNGLDGKDGYTPVKGVDYFDGINGVDGKDGLDGINGVDGKDGKDVDPATVINLQNEDLTLQNNINSESNIRWAADNKLQSNINSVNSRVDSVSKRVSALEKTQYNIRAEVDFIREKNLTVGVYSKYNTNRNVCAEVGVAVTVGIGKSWTERELEKTNARLDRLERMATGQAAVITKTVNKKGKLVSLQISSESLKVGAKF